MSIRPGISHVERWAVAAWMVWAGSLAAGELAAPVAPDAPVLRVLGSRAGRDVRMDLVQAAKPAAGEKTVSEASDPGSSRELVRLRVRLAKVEQELAAEKAKASAQAVRYRDEGLIRRGKVLREQLEDPYDTSLVWSLNDAGLLFLADGKWDRAEELFRRALVILDHGPGRTSLAGGTLLQHLADTLWRKHDLVSAESLYRESAQAFGISLGTNHPRYGAALNGWASVLRALGKDAEAERHYREAIALYERVRKVSPGDLAAPLHNLALLLLDQARIDEAGPLIERAARLMEQPGVDGARAVVVMRTMTRYCRVIGDLERATYYEEKAQDLIVEAMTE